MNDAAEFDVAGTDNPEDLFRPRFSDSDIRQARLEGQPPGQMLGVIQADAVAPPLGASEFVLTSLKDQSAPDKPPTVINIENASGPINFIDESDGVVVSESAYLPAGEVAALGRPYGVGSDADTLIDNISARAAVTYSSLEQGDTIGGVAILETSKQIGDTPFFLHGGFAAEFLDGDYPMSISLGASKLATIQDGQVVKPLILSASYDAYFDSEFFGASDLVIIDQVRALAGWAINPYTDIGVWGARGLDGNMGINRSATGVLSVQGELSNRVAGYIARDIGLLNSRVMASVGWEDMNGNLFAEADAFMPLTNSINIFGGGGYSASGSWDAIAGLEFVLPGSRLAKRTYKARKATAYSTAGDGLCDSCGASDPECVDCSVCDICSTRHRGGMAYDVYRSALRVITPSRMRRMTDFRIVFTPNGQPPIIIVDPIEPPVDPPGPENNCIERWDNREVRESRLSQWLDNNDLQDLILPVPVPGDLQLPFEQAMDK